MNSHACTHCHKKELHQGHLGSMRMKNLARNTVWWPKLDSEIEELVSRCSHCQSMRPEAPAASVHPWEFPEKPWYRLHIDFAGPKFGYYWLVVIDARTKWPEVIPMKNATAEATVQGLLSLIARFGIPGQIVSDNGPQFTSEEFRTFCAQFQIQHVRSSPYHPRSTPRLWCNQPL
jgi:transposase InsO family protein